MSRLAVGVLITLFCISLASADPLKQEGRFAAAGLNEREVEAFFMTFREAISSGDKKKVASLINYPIKVTVAGVRRTIRNRAEFIKAYDRIFDETFRELIVKTEVSDLWARWSGVATPRGEIWFAGICLSRSCNTYRIKITAINGPIRS